MNSINRFNPVAVATSVNIHGVRMRECNDGAWVSYDMHKKEIESLQARLKALESTQKHQVSVPSASEPPWDTDTAWSRYEQICTALSGCQLASQYK